LRKFNPEYRTFQKLYATGDLIKDLPVWYGFIKQMTLYGNGQGVKKRIRKTGQSYNSYKNFYPIVFPLIKEKKPFEILVFPNFSLTSTNDLLKTEELDFAIRFIQDGDTVILPSFSPENTGAGLTSFMLNQKAFILKYDPDLSRVTGDEFATLTDIESSLYKEYYFDETNELSGFVMANDRIEGTYTKSLTGPAGREIAFFFTFPPDRGKNLIALNHPKSRYKSYPGFMDDFYAKNKSYWKSEGEKSLKESFFTDQNSPFTIDTVSINFEEAIAKGEIEVVTKIHAEDIFKKSKNYRILKLGDLIDDIPIKPDSIETTQEQIVFVGKQKFTWKINLTFPEAYEPVGLDNWIKEYANNIGSFESTTSFVDHKLAFKLTLFIDEYVISKDGIRTYVALGDELKNLMASKILIK
jgi:hypothetical protein